MVVACDQLEIAVIVVRRLIGLRKRFVLLVKTRFLVTAKFVNNSLVSTKSLGILRLDPSNFWAFNHDIP